MVSTFEKKKLRPHINLGKIQDYFCHGVHFNSTEVEVSNRI